MEQSSDGGKYEEFVGSMVIIYWDDIAGFADAWMDFKEIYEMRPHKCYTIGILFEVTEEYITIASTCDDLRTIVSDINCIPIGCITSINKLKEIK
jgi:hypothetical protein